MHAVIVRYVENDNCFIPRQLIPDKFIQFAADNIDILEETLDKSPTFHGTQIVVFQKSNMQNDKRGEKLNILPYKVKLNIPENFHLLRKLNYNKSNKPLPIISEKNLFLSEFENI